MDNKSDNYNILEGIEGVSELKTQSWKLQTLYSFMYKNESFDTTGEPDDEGRIMITMNSGGLENSIPGAIMSKFDTIHIINTLNNLIDTNDCIVKLYNALSDYLLEKDGPCVVNAVNRVNQLTGEFIHF